MSDENALSTETVLVVGQDTNPLHSHFLRELANIKFELLGMSGDLAVVPNQPIKFVVKLEDGCVVTFGPVVVLTTAEGEADQDEGENGGNPDATGATTKGGKKQPRAAGEPN